MALRIIACVVGVSVDPFFLYVPFLSDTMKCLGMNTNICSVASFVRFFGDLAYIAPKAVEYTDSKKFVSLMYFFAVVPIPQVLFSKRLILKTLGGYMFWNLSLFCQYGTRLVIIFRWCEELETRVSAITLERFKALVYIFLYIIVSHVIGASWYYLSIKRQVSCWQHACKIDTVVLCDGNTTSTLNCTLANEHCSIHPPNATDYGIYLDALQSDIVEDKGLLNKFLRSFSWGLRHLSSFASNLQTSTNRGETCFAIIISVVALLLLIYIIGNIQRYTEMASARSERIVDKMKAIKPKIKLLAKRHNLGDFKETSIGEHIQKALENDKDSFNFDSFDIHTHDRLALSKDLDFLETRILLNPKKLNIQEKAEKWLSDNKIPHDQNNDILFYLKCGLKDDEDVNLTSVLSVLLDESKWMTMKDLCFHTLKKVPQLHNIDEEWFKSMSSKLKPVVYPKESYIFREGEPLDFIIFITSGVAWSYTTRTNASSKSLQKGDFFGEELVQWKLDTDTNRRELESDRIPLSCIPISTANVKSHTQVEALVFMTKDLALCSDFPVDRSRSANSATEGVASSSRTVEGASVQKEIEEEGPSVRRESEEVINISID